MASRVKTLDKLPKPSSEGHLWADYVELLCLFNVDSFLSRSDVLARAQQREDLGGELDELEQEISRAVSGTDEEAEDEEPSRSGDSKAGAISDQWESKANDWFDHLRYRSSIFGDFYPFYLSDDGIDLHRRSTITDKHRLYVFLLVLSNLKYFRGLQSLLTSDFEIVSGEVLRRCVPKNAEVHVFSRNQFSSDRYRKLNLWGKINRLASDIRDKVEIPESEFSPRDTADNGLDLVAWLPFHESDHANGLIIFFGQCACDQSWPDKQEESGTPRWRGTLRMKVRANNIVFIPFCFRNSDGTWFKEHRLFEDTILIDRFRFLFLLRRAASSFQHRSSYKAINDLLTERENTF